MATVFTKTVLGVALGASAVVASVPADAQWRRGGGWDRGWDRGRGRDNTGTAIVAGIAGLAIGAALTSGRDRYDRRYNYDYNYYDQRGYFPNDGYYARNYHSRNRGYDACYTRRVYDPYIDRVVRVRYCDGY